MALTTLDMKKNWLTCCPETTGTWTKLVNFHMLEFPSILNKGTVENSPLPLEIDHLTSEEDEAKPEASMLNIHGGGGDHGLYNNGGVDKA